MPFQKQVNLYPAAGAPGMQAGLNPMAMALPVPLAATGGVIIGHFVWPVSGSPDQVTTTGTGQPLGIVRRVQDGVIPSGAEASMTISAGRPVPVVIKGDLLVVSAAPATAGQKVFAVLATGLIVAGAAGATIAGAIETTWRIVTSASAGDVFQISNW